MLKIIELQNSLLSISRNLSNGNQLVWSFAKTRKAYENVKEKFKDAGKPKESVAFEAARNYISGEIAANDPIADLVAFAIHKKIDSQNQSVFNNPEKLDELLTAYKAKCERGVDMAITWNGLMRSYFEANPVNTSNRYIFDQAQEKIRLFLNETWDQVKKSTEFKLTWMSSIDENLDLLSSDPCSRYAKYWFEGNDRLVLKVSSEIQIPSASWFWEKLFISCVQHVVNLEDQNFKKDLSKLFVLFDQKKIYRDIALRAVLDRYARSADLSVNKDLKEYSIDLWGSPEGHQLAGNSWSKVSEPALKMMLNWVNESNLRLFFELLKQRGFADDERLNFWLKYIRNVNSSKLVLGPNSRRFVESRADLRSVFGREKSNYSLLLHDANIDNDAFLMSIGGSLIVDFSVQGGCYVYRPGTNNFSIDAKNHVSSTARSGLKENYHKDGMAFAHTPGWTDSHRAPYILRSKYGISPGNANLYNSNQGSVKIDVNNYFNSLKFSESVTTQSAPVTSSILYDYQDAVKKAKSLCWDNGLDYSDLGDEFRVKHYINDDPIAEELKVLGFIFNKSSGWSAK